MGSGYKRHNKLWIRFFLLAVFATMYIRDHIRKDFYAGMGMDATEFDMEVFRKTSTISKQVFPLEIDLENPKFKRILDGMVRHTEAMAAAEKAGGLFGKIRKSWHAGWNAISFARLFLLPVKDNTPPKDFRLEPAY